MTAPNHDERHRIRQAFRRPVSLPVRITPHGFDVAEDHYDHLEGKIIKTTLARKLFEDSFLACSSSDGLRSEYGKLCAECRHPRCQPRLRIQLASERTIFVLELPATSAENYFALEDEADRLGASLADWTVRLTVIDRGHWGEIVFERFEAPR